MPENTNHIRPFLYHYIILSKMIIKNTYNVLCR